MKEEKKNEESLLLPVANVDVDKERKHRGIDSSNNNYRSKGTIGLIVATEVKKAAAATILLF